MRPQRIQEKKTILAKEEPEPKEKHKKCRVCKDIHDSTRQAEHC